MQNKKSLVLMLALMAAGCTREVYLQPVPCVDCEPEPVVEEPCPEPVKEVQTYQVFEPCPCQPVCVTCVPVCVTCQPVCTTCQTTYTYTTVQPVVQSYTTTYTTTYEQY